MHPVLDSWLNAKNDPVEDCPAVGNVSRSWQWREWGTDPPNYPSNKKVFENIAEDTLVQKSLQIRSFDLPGYPRSTFLMVFSPDGTKVASTHGNHNVYVSELASGKHVKILKGHPRTPWCISFHPSHPQLIGSGCLGGQVRVWDIASGGSEMWSVRNETVVASIAFHPREQLLVIATFNELYFWDWSHPAPFTRVTTNNVHEKVRYVAFDALGYKLITGISLWASPINANSHPLSTSSSSSGGPSSAGGNGGSSGGPGGSGGVPGGGGPGGGGPGGGGPGSGPGGIDGGGPNEGGDDAPSNRQPDSPGAAQDMIVNSYQTLVQRYDSLVRNYQRLFMVRHRLTNTPPPNNTIDRGTDPMETYPIDIGRRRRSTRRSSRTNNDTVNPSPSTPRRNDGGDSGDGESSSRFLNLDVLSFDSDASRTPDSPTRERSPIASASSAFQPLNESVRSFRTVDQRERTRLLPNPFSSRSSQPTGVPESFREYIGRNLPSVDLNSSRTSIFTSSRADSMLGRDFVVLRRRNSPAPAGASSPPAADPVPSTSASASASTSNTRTTTNSSTQMSPDADNVDAQTINESLDLIRDILRDSGTRLLNLITNMSMNLMSGRSERSERGGIRRSPRMRLLADDLHRDLFASSSDSDSDRTVILSALNSSYREPEADAVPGPASQTGRDASDTPTDRMVFELEEVASASGRFRVRTQSGDDPLATADERNLPNAPGPSEPPPRAEPEFDPNIPSTSRDNFWSRGPDMPSAEAYRRVRRGVSALQKHTLELAHTWLRGDRLSMKQLRIMWENLRRRVLALQRETGRHDSPGYYTRGLLQRCMILTEMTDLASQHMGRERPPERRSTSRNEENQRNSSNVQENGTSSDGTSASTSTANAEPEASTSTERRPYNRPTNLRSSRSTGSSRASPFFRRRFPSSHRWQSAEGMRRARNQPRSAPRHTRRDFARAFEMSTTKHEIRMRAMQVLSVMFNMMMMCLGERGLSQVIMHMLRALKKALALSCFMMMSTRNNPARSGSTATLPSQNMDSDVVRIQNAEHAGPVNVDGPDDPASPRVSVPSEERNDSAPRARNAATKPPDPSTATTSSRSTAVETTTQRNNSSVETANCVSKKWSHRLAVQIAVANRNTSSTARTRRELYLESKRQKALHRTNPGAHPVVRRRIPLLSTHRIPALRRLPARGNLPRAPPNVAPQNEEPVAGPSNAPQENVRRDSSRIDINDFDSRVNLIRIAHMQAIRLRNAARSRFRRLQTIRLYTPSSVFSLQSNPNENSAENRDNSQNNGESSRMPFISLPSSAPGGGEGTPVERRFQGVLSNVGLIHVNQHHMSANMEGQGSLQQRLPRIHEYLQPIILAQNAMVVEDDGDIGAGGGLGRRMGGMAGLLDAGIISEALPAPFNRVQAWDFTSGQTPDIADSTKNIVVQRCRIHNDASIDISKDGRLIVALLPGTRLRNSNSWLGIYSLDWNRLGHCLHTVMLEQSAVSVALSPTTRYLAVGLGSRRFTSAPHTRSNAIALLYKLDPQENSGRTVLSPIKELMQHWEHGFTSLNCLRWAPQPGQGLVYANNTGQLVIMS